MTIGTRFNPQELCSRKLWELINNNRRDDDDRRLLEAAIAELEERRSYLAELQDFGKSHAHN
jgi:hypothetical protein